MKHKAILFLLFCGSFGVPHYVYSQTKEPIQDISRTSTDPQREISNADNGDFKILFKVNENNKVAVQETIKSKAYTNEVEFEKTNDAYLIDFSYIMNVYQTRVNKENVNRTYTGDRLLYPLTLSAGQKLPEAKGQYLLDIKGGTRIIQNVSCTDRSVLRFEKIEHEGTQIETAVISSTYHFESSIDGKVLDSTISVVTDWYNKDKGLVKRTRH